ncbi:hypothetical protein BDW22DRAFT_1349770 [Trametopsis cervina]|nr:hypothetical protein BDW22DRAFT_1349770 [Trametopsis cervina]
MQQPLQLLKLNDDVLALVCAAVRDLIEVDLSITSRYIMHLEGQVSETPLKNLSLTCKHIRELCLPYLFSSLVLYSRVDNSWFEALRRIEEWNRAHAKYTSEVFIYIELEWMFKPEPFSASLPARLVGLLQTVASTGAPLEKLTVVANEAHAAAFDSAFSAPGVVFPDVRRLIVSPELHPVVRCCPGTRMLNGWNFSWTMSRTRGHTSRLFNEAKRLADLECFVLRERWGPAIMTELRDSIQNVRVLVIPALSMLDYDLSFETFVSHLSRIRGIEILSIPVVAGLHVGYAPVARDDEEHRRLMYQQRVEAEERVAPVLFEKCAGLKELWFDEETRVMRRETGDGVGELVWARGDETGRPIWHVMMGNVSEND